MTGTEFERLTEFMETASKPRSVASYNHQRELAKAKFSPEAIYKLDSSGYINKFLNKPKIQSNEEVQK